MKGEVIERRRKREMKKKGKKKEKKQYLDIFRKCACYLVRGILS